MLMREQLRGSGSADPVLAVGCRGDPQVVGNPHPPVVGLQVDEAPGFLARLLVGVRVEGQAVELAVPH